jgi:ABC-type polysaccharide/polyol phosphate export permease
MGNMTTMPETAQGAIPAMPVYDSSEVQIRPMQRAVAEVIQYKDLLRLLIATNIKARYKRSVLGIAWTQLNPLLTMIVITIAFSAIFRFAVPKYPVYVLAGLVFFGFFQESTTQCMNSLVWGSGLLKKVYIPAEVFPISAVGTALVNLGLSLLPLVLIMMYFKQPLRWTMLFVPAAMLMIAGFSLGIGLLLASIAVGFSDVVEMWGVVVRALFYLTPVMYPEKIVPERLLFMVRSNPLYHMMLCWREPIYSGALPPTDSVLKAFVWSAAALFIGWWVFSRRSHEFALRA